MDKEQVKEILLKHQVDQLVTEHIAACYAKPQEGGTAWFIDNLVNDLDALLSPKGEGLLTDEEIDKAWPDKPQKQGLLPKGLPEGVIETIANEVLIGGRMIAQAQYDKDRLAIEQARQETEAISYSKGVVDGREQVFEEIEKYKRRCDECDCDYCLMDFELEDLKDKFLGLAPIPEIDMEQELADQRHNACDDTIG